VTPTLVFIYGPPASGKLTVAEELARRATFRVLHNHLTLDAITPVLPIETPGFWPLVRRVRREIVSAAAAAGVNLVFTYVFAPGEEHIVDEIATLYPRVLYVRLTAPREELMRRVGNESRRRFGKPVTEEALAEILTEWDVFQPIPARESLTINTATTSPGRAADLIVAAL